MGLRTGQPALHELLAWTSVVQRATLRCAWSLVSVTVMLSNSGKRAVQALQAQARAATAARAYHKNVSVLS